MVDGESHAITTYKIEGSPGNKTGNGMFGRFRWSPSLKKFIVLTSLREPVYMISWDNTGGGSGEPDPVVVPIDDLFEAILPDIKNLGTATARRSSPLKISGDGGDREEIGLFTEWQSEWIAKRKDSTVSQQEIEALQQYIIGQADQILDYPWGNYEEIGIPLWKGGKYALSFSHMPNAFFIPFLLTKDEKYIQPMRDLWLIYQKHRQLCSAEPCTKGMKWITGRGLAWNLRNLAQLAFLEKHGFIPDSGNQYRTALENTRQEILSRLNDPYESEFHALGLTHWTTPTFTGWMESFIATVFAYTVNLGFDEWTSIASWHTQHFVERCGGKWAMKYCDPDHVALADNGTALNWSQVKPATDARMAALADWPDNVLADQVVNGVRITYSDRFDNALSGVAAYCNIGINQACTLRDELVEQRQLRVNRTAQDAKYYKYSLFWRD